MFPQWMSNEEYRESYFEDPADLKLKLDTAFMDYVSKHLRGVLTNEQATEQSVVAVVGGASLYGFLHISELIDKVAGKVLAHKPTLAINAKDEAELRRAVALEAAGGYEFEYLRFVKVKEASSLLQSNHDNIEQGASFTLTDKQFVREEKSQDGSSTFDHNWFDWNEPIDVGSGNLPRIRQEGVTYFVTFRTADSLPAEKWKAWKTEREEWLEKNPKPHTDQQKKEYYAKFPAQIEKWLDQNYGALVLAESEPNKIVDDALHHFDGDRYVLDE